MAGLLRDKRFLLIALLIAMIAGTFWSGSRYPALDEKAALGGALVLEDPLGFDPVLHFDPTASFLERLGVTTLNWLYTNRQGMTFGVLLAAAFMTAFTLLRRVSFESAFANTLLGVVLGAPLGVCVNCAAPIARGLYASGARLETALAAMVSSPTLNVIVLAMLFSLFPFYLAAIKLGFTLLFLLIMIPVLSRTVFGEQHLSAAGAGRLGPHVPWAAEPVTSVGDAALGWGGATAWVGREYGRHLWFIVRTTVPLMFLAGFLGALVVTAMPWDQLTDYLPFMGRTAIIASMAALALLGLSLPVPMAFDVVLAAALLAGGVPVKYVAVLLFTLGIFSVYSFLIVGRAVSWRVAATMTVVLLGLGMGAGVTSHFYAERDAMRKREIFLATFRDWDVERPASADLPVAEEDDEVIAALRPDARTWATLGTSDDGLIIERSPLREPAPGPGQLFTRYDGRAFGLERPDNIPAIYKFTSPFYRDFPIAAGDVHGDGWIDLLVGSDRGVHLFTNRRGEGFVRQDIAVPALRGRYVANTALVDLNNDGWLDVFASIYRGGNLVVFNDRGRFRAAGLRRLPPTEASVANATAFADLDRDGRVDIVLGNYSAGTWTPSSPPASRNAILWNTADGFRPELLPGPVGETLSTLVSDIDGDGHLDLLVGNDFSPPDSVYLGGANGLRLITRADNLVPRSTYSTMSIDSADVDNDLRPEILFAQVTGRSPEGRRRLEWRTVAATCDVYDDDPTRTRCENDAAVHRVVHRSLESGDPSRCDALDDPLARADCVAFLMLETAARGRHNQDLCALFPPAWETFAFMCNFAFRPSAAERPHLDPGAIPQIFNSNVLLKRAADGGWVDRAEDAGLDVTGWSWNARFADLDHDEWQDLYVVNGSYRHDEREANMLFRNRAGQGFELDRDRSGLSSFLMTATYVYIDFDHDGDLDIVEVAAEGPMWLYRNNQTSGQAILLELRDEIGNHFGLGARVVIHYGPDGRRHQMREVKSSGGFLSYDAPRLHFGLGEHDVVHRLEIWWSTGERTELAGPLPAGYRYRITRPR